MSADIGNDFEPFAIRRQVDHGLVPPDAVARRGIEALVIFVGMVAEIAQVFLLEIAQARQGIRIENGAEWLGVQGMVWR